jgi:hypothetical protein
VYIEDSHAGTFYWIARNLDLTSPHELVLVDAHNDATEIPDSDIVRQRILESAGTNRLDSLFEDWRKRGAIQCFNWIEPLLPSPVNRVWWLAGDSLTDAELDARQQQVWEQINAHEMIRPRASGDLSGRYQVMDWGRFHRARFAAPVIVSIDLDYFAGARHSGRVAEVLDAALSIPGIEALTLAISRPYLRSDEEAHALLTEALRYLVRVVNVDIEMAPFAETGEDRSILAKSWYAKGQNPPRYHLESAPVSLRTLIVQNRDRIRGCERWVERWRAQAPKVGGRWILLAPAAPAFNVTGEQQGFADRSTKFVRFVEREIPGPEMLTGLGTFRVFSERDGAMSDIVEITHTEGVGYPARLTELFQLPYIYGSALLNPDRRIGADCASFIIYGARREGRDIPYVNPQGLLPYLREIGEFPGFEKEPVAVTDEMVRRGVLLHFGKHIAAVYRATDGVLQASTPVVHQLEGYPEITTFGAMAAKYPRIRVMMFR